jgi:hypothetical protein
MKRKAFFSSWKTTVAGFAKGGIIVAVIAAVVTMEDPEQVIVTLLAAYGAIEVGQGVASRDADKSSQDAGIR